MGSSITTTYYLHICCILQIDVFHFIKVKTLFVSFFSSLSSILGRRCQEIDNLTKIK